MRVRLLTKDPVEDFADNHANGRKHFNKWLIEVKYADWTVPEDLLKTYTGNLLGNNRVVFDLGGNGRNAFRMICTFIFGRRKVRLYVNWIGTHEEYNSLSAEEKMTVWNY